MDPGHPRMLRTKRGGGYVLEAQLLPAAEAR
jgi:hypothetical protein